jgi:hypothetical protein
MLSSTDGSKINAINLPSSRVLPHFFGDDAAEPDVRHAGVGRATDAEVGDRSCRTSVRMLNFTFKFNKARGV